MNYKRFGSTIAVRIDRGEEILKSIAAVCEKEQVKCAGIEGIGAVDHAVVGLYRVAEKKYYSNTFDGEMEMTSLLGNVSVKDGSVYLHCHANFAKADGQVVGGHLNEAVISGTGELLIRMENANLGRRPDPVTGLNIFDL